MCTLSLKDITSIIYILPVWHSFNGQGHLWWHHAACQKEEYVLYQNSLCWELFFHDSYSINVRSEF